MNVYNNLIKFACKLKLKGCIFHFFAIKHCFSLRMGVEVFKERHSPQSSFITTPFPRIKFVIVLLDNSYHI